MRAAGVTEFGGPEALHIVDVPEEHAGPGQVRLGGTAAGGNPTPTHLVLGAHAGRRRVPGAAVNPTAPSRVLGPSAERDPVKPPPWVPGMDVAGIVDEVGDG